MVTKNADKNREWEQKTRSVSKNGKEEWGMKNGNG